MGFMFNVLFIEGAYRLKSLTATEKIERKTNLGALGQGKAQGTMSLSSREGTKLV